MLHHMNVARFLLTGTRLLAVQVWVESHEWGRKYSRMRYCFNLVVLFLVQNFWSVYVKIAFYSLFPSLAHDRGKASEKAENAVYMSIVLIQQKCEFCAHVSSR